MTTFLSEAEDAKRLRIVAALILDTEGKTLLVRKRGTTAFMQAGGKPVEGESSLSALDRELTEELGCGLDRQSCQSLGTYRAPAVNEPGWTVEAELYAVSLLGEARPSGEIEETIWIDPETHSGVELAALTTAHVLPIARRLSQLRRAAAGCAS
ncbi:MAG TPA: NUDIX domain-containing protein [Allosphingosinicella sp.]|jgi:8-oxo-dGTP pyrophosphatase MutT (NUDIX family)